MPVPGVTGEVRSGGFAAPSLVAYSIGAVSCGARGPTSPFGRQLPCSAMVAPVGARGSRARRGKGTPFAPLLLALGGVALAIRLVYALAVAPGQITPGDAHVYHELADALAGGHGYNLFPRFHRNYPTAEHPPLFPLYLAVFSK